MLDVSEHAVRSMRGLMMLPLFPQMQPIIGSTTTRYASAQLWCLLTRVQ